MPARRASLAATLGTPSPAAVRRESSGVSSPRWRSSVSPTLVVGILKSGAAESAIAHSKGETASATQDCHVTSVEA
jgi:hypothetical protein